MPIRKLLLPLNGTVAGESALVVALRVAARFHAHLLALHVRPDSRDLAPLAGEGLPGAMMAQMMAAAEQEGDARGSAAAALFDRLVHGVGIAAAPPGRGNGPSAEFRVLVGREEEVVAQEARLADLTVVPHPEAVDDISSSDALHAVLFDSGRPVLIAPRHVAEAGAAVGSRVAVAWSGTAEAAAAVQTALPWLATADAVRVLASPDYQRPGPSPAELVAYLALHGVSAEIGTFAARDREAGAGLLAAARDWGADLLTMGAYSHSRLRQLFLGGVTRHVLEHATLPVLMNR